MDDDAAQRQRMLIFTAGTGIGHNVVARAVDDGIRERWPRTDIRTIDLLDLMPSAVSRAIRESYVHGMTSVPRLYGLLYYVADRHHSPTLGIAERLRNVFQRWMLRSAAKLLQEFQPKLVLHTHFLGISTVAALRKRRRIPIEQAAIVTDVIPNRVWFSTEVQHWFVAAPETGDKLRRWGISEASVTISGIPVHRVWDQTVDPDRVRADWSLSPGTVVLLTGGAAFTVGPIAELAQRIAAACPDAVIVVLCGTNRALQESLRRLPGVGTRIIAVPFTDRVHELVSAATIFVTKPGGATTSECLARGTPMVLLPPVPGQEAGNAAWLKMHSAAVVARDLDDVVRQVCRLADDESARTALSRAAHALHRPGREAVVRYVGEVLGLR